MTTDTQSSFADTKGARILALLIALAIAALLFVNWSDDFANLFSGKQSSSLPQAQQVPSDAAETNPALAACLEKRIGDVDQMKEDGVLSEAQYAAFRERAESLCRQQNPVQQ